MRVRQFVCSTTGEKFEAEGPDPQCPKCGAKHFERTNKEDLSSSFFTELVGHMWGRFLEAIRVTSDAGRCITTDAHSGGCITNSTQAKPRHGETGNLEVCSKLIQRLNGDGDRWTNCTCSESSDDDVDCRAYEGARVLEVQIARAVYKRSFWAALARVGVARYSVNADEASDQMRDAIEKKRHVARKGLVLVLDSIETPGHITKHVLSSFHSRHGAWAKSLGFGAIWVVGPADLTFRLDA